MVLSERVILVNKGIPLMNERVSLVNECLRITEWMFHFMDILCFYSEWRFMLSECHFDRITICTFVMVWELWSRKFEHYIVMPLFKVICLAFYLRTNSQDKLCVGWLQFIKEFHKEVMKCLSWFNTISTFKQHQFLPCVIVQNSL